MSIWKNPADDPLLRGVDLLLCTEPVYLCKLMHMLPLEKENVPLIGYFANPLTAYIPPGLQPEWQEQFYALVHSTLDLTV